MPFRSFDSLYVFNIVASRMSFSLAADFLNLSKGAISYRISQLESELGFRLFQRRHTRITLTEKGERLWANSQNTLSQLEEVIETLRDDGRQSITLGTHTYFLSRWLTPRLTGFIQAYPNVAVRLEPINDLRDIHNREVDLAIFWGAGPWSDLYGKVFRKSACYPMASPALAKRVAETGLAAAMRELPLLIDPIGEAAWREDDTGGGSGGCRVGDEAARVALFRKRLDRGGGGGSGVERIERPVMERCKKRRQVKAAFPLRVGDADLDRRRGRCACQTGRHKKSGRRKAGQSSDCHGFLPLDSHYGGNSPRVTLAGRAGFPASRSLTGLGGGVSFVRNSGRRTDIRPAVRLRTNRVQARSRR